MSSEPEPSLAGAAAAPGGARGDARFLARASSLLSGSLDSQAVLEQLAALAVPDMADWCIVHLRDPSGAVAPVAIAAADPAKLPLAWGWARQLPPDVLRQTHLGAVLEGAGSVLVERIDDAMLRRAVADPAQLAMIRGLGLCSALVVPLAGRQGVLGALSFVSARSDRRFTEEDREVAEDLGRRAALAVDNARLYEAERRARAASEASEQKYRFLCELMPQLVWSADERGEPDFCNRNFLDYTGLTLNDLRDGGWPRVIHPDDAERAAGRWQSAVARAEGFEDIVRIRRHDGFYRWFLVRARPLLDIEGRVVKWMGTDTDIHDQKLAFEGAQAADRRKDEFLALLGHELRNPLTPIVTAVRLMELKGDTRTEREREVIARQVAHLSRLVDDLLDVSRITRGKLELKRTRVEMAAVVAKAIEMASPLLEQRTQNLAIDVPRVGLAVEADEIRLAQVLQNLLTNAAKYTQPGGHIRVRAFRDAGEAVVSVKDDGMGIAPDLLPSIFELFVQGERTIDRAEGGLGIGLTLVERLVSLHGGRVTARSEGPGKGSEFLVRLPASPPFEAAVPAAAAEVVLPALRPAIPGRRVLVVDDNVDIADTLAEALESVGHEVAVAHDGPAALGIVERFHPEVALLDIGLPVMDGYELARRLRRQLANAPTRLIAITGYGQEADRQRSREAGFEHHVVKPIDLDEIQRLIEAPTPA